MPSNETHIHRAAVGDEVIECVGQALLVSVSTDPSDPINTIQISADGFVGAPLVLPNSTEGVPSWDPIPGTAPVLEARQDGHYPPGYIRVRVA